MSGSNPSSGWPGSSALLDNPKYAAALSQVLHAGETVLDSRDARFEVFVNHNMQIHDKTAIVLTNQRLLAVRNKGTFGLKPPFILDLVDIDEVAVTAQGNVSITWRTRLNSPELWKLQFRNESISDGWMTRLHAMASGAQPGANAADVVAPSVPGGAERFDVFRARLQNLLDHLEPQSGRLAAGKPFGAGSGLEAAVGCVQAHMGDADNVRRAGSMVAADLLEAMAARQITMADIEQVMGLAALRERPDTPKREAAAQLGGAASTYLNQFNVPSGNMWQLWQRNDEVAEELLCWLSVVRLRLASVAKMDVVERMHL